MGTAATILLPQISHPGRSRPGRRAFRRRLKFLCASAAAISGEHCTAYYFASCGIAVDGAEGGCVETDRGRPI